MAQPLTKLTITGYTDDKRTVASVHGTFVAMYNPESVTVRYGAFYKEPPSESELGYFSHHSPKVVSLTLILDGTGVGGAYVNVAAKVAHFLDVCYEKVGEIHEPNYLRLEWDPLRQRQDPTFSCRLESVEVNYTVFAANGAPLRAELVASFVEQLDPEKLAAKERTSSPDLSHLRVVARGDTLPLLCQAIYGSPKHYIRVAQVNGLDDLRELTPGTTLIFPPFDRRGRALWGSRGRRKDAEGER